jgi:WD40 repeat protein
MFATCSADCNVNVYSTNTSALLHSLKGHSG